MEVTPGDIASLAGSEVVPSPSGKEGHADARRLTGTCLRSTAS